MNTVDVGSLSFTYWLTGCAFHYSSQCCTWLIPFHPNCCWQTYFRCSCLVFNVYLEHGSVRSCCASLLLKKVNHDAVNVKYYWPLLSTDACWGIMKAPEHNALVKFDNALIQRVKSAIFVFPVLPGSAEAQVIWAGIVKCLLIPYFIGRICVKNIKDPFTCVKVIASQTVDVFWDTVYIVFHKKRGITFVIITLENFDGL